MGTSEEINRRYPKNIELDASLVPAGPQYPGSDGHDLRPSPAVSPP